MVTKPIANCIDENFDYSHAVQLNTCVSEEEESSHYFPSPSPPPRRPPYSSLVGVSMVSVVDLHNCAMW
jgi:hypothetical protein